MEDKFKYTYHNNQRYIEGSYEGAVDSNKALTVTKLMIEQMHNHKCYRVLFDASQALSSATTAENFEFALNLSQLLEELGDSRWAVFYKNDHFIYEMIHKMIIQAGIETVYMSQDKNDALNWLLQV